MTHAAHESSRCWRKAISLVVWVYRLTRKLPADEKSGLSAAMRRSATAAAQQVADADGREDVSEAIKHYQAALAALRELSTSGVICRRLRYVGAMDLRALRRRVASAEALIEADLETCEDEREALSKPLPKLTPKSKPSLELRDAA